MSKVVVVGAGAMGLAAAYHAAKAGHHVTVLEAGPEAGGMAAHFDFAGTSIERFYHFVCTPDAPTFALLEELGLADAMRWRRTTMGLFAGGKLHPWGDPVALLRYPGVSLIARLRYGLLAFVSTRRDRWDALETQTAREWITRWAGAEAYAKLWQPLLHLKFFEYADNVSAAWIWTRVKRLGRSRKSLFEERLGYIEGGSQTLVDRLCERIGELGGAIHLSSPATWIISEDGRVTGVQSGEAFFPADAVISTVPTPLVPAMVPDLPSELRERYAAIPNIGVCCLLFKLRRSVTPNFWVNIAEPGIEVPGIIEFTNLRPLPGGRQSCSCPTTCPSPTRNSAGMTTGCSMKRSVISGALTQPSAKTMSSTVMSPGCAMPSRSARLGSPRRSHRCRPRSRGCRLRIPASTIPRTGAFPKACGWPRRWRPRSEPGGLPPGAHIL